MGCSGGVSSLETALHFFTLGPRDLISTSIPTTKSRSDLPLQAVLQDKTPTKLARGAAIEPPKTESAPPTRSKPITDTQRWKKTGLYLQRTEQRVRQPWLKFQTPPGIES